MKTTSTKFYPFNTLKETPPNWISVSPVRIFGVFIGRNLKVAMKGYQWSNGKIEE